jgi:hypothetical protein
MFSLKNNVVLLALFAVCLCAPGFLRAEFNEDGWNGNLNVVIGAKRFSDDPWKPVDSQPSYGLMFDAGRGDWPLHLALDVYYSADKGTAEGRTRDGSTTEFDLGMRKVWRASKTFRPFIGVGSAIIQAQLKDTSVGVPARSDSDTGAGVWIGGGMYWTLARVLNIGFNLKYSTAKVTLLDERLDAGGRYFGTIVGLSW